MPYRNIHMPYRNIEAQKIVFGHPSGSARVAVGCWWVVVFKVDKTLFIYDVSVQNHRPLLSYSLKVTLLVPWYSLSLPFYILLSLYLSLYD